MCPFYWSCSKPSFTFLKIEVWLHRFSLRRSGQRICKYSSAYASCLQQKLLIRYSPLGTYHQFRIGKIAGSQVRLYSVWLMATGSILPALYILCNMPYCLYQFPPDRTGRFGQHFNITNYIQPDVLFLFRVSVSLRMVFHQGHQSHHFVLRSVPVFGWKRGIQGKGILPQFCTAFTILRTLSTPWEVAMRRSCPFLWPIGHFRHNYSNMTWRSPQVNLLLKDLHTLVLKCTKVQKFG